MGPCWGRCAWGALHSASMSTIPDRARLICGNISVEPSVAKKPIAAKPSARTLRVVQGYGNKLEITLERGEGATGEIKLESIRPPAAPESRSANAPVAWMRNGLAGGPASP